MTESGFAQRIRQALDDPALRANFRHAMGGFIERRAAQFPDAGDLRLRRDRAAAIRADSLRRLPELLETLEQRLEANGIHVHWAESAEQANALIARLLAERGIGKVVKGKSMVTEEIGLNDHLAGQGVQVIESDLGEFIIQLAGEAPSHIVVPAVHKNRRQIAELFRRHIRGVTPSEDVDQLTAIARRELRRHFATAGAGISGVNFLVAETGTLCLIENEGNGRMTTTVPPLHIAVTGIEKVIPRLADLAPLLDLLPKSATGQPITTYVNLIHGPRRGDELDGPQEVHLVLLDNGRSLMQCREGFIDTLRCIRCGACINHCPVFVQIGGHAYGSTYPGPIGLVLEPQRLGIERAGDLLSACSLCGRCGEVCPVQIPLPSLISRLRHEAVEPAAEADAALPGQGALRRPLEAVAWKVWSLVNRHPRLYRTLLALMTRLRGLAPRRLGGWTRYRSAPRPARRSLHQLMARRSSRERP
jgi:L-lactate dehydrogenase complex protein LldF